MNFIDCVSYYAPMESYKENRITSLQVLLFARRLGVLPKLLREINKFLIFVNHVRTGLCNDF